MAGPCGASTASQAAPRGPKLVYHLILELQTNHQQSFYNGGEGCEIGTQI